MNVAISRDSHPAPTLIVERSLNPFGGSDLLTVWERIDAWHEHAFATLRSYEATDFAAVAIGAVWYGRIGTRRNLPADIEAMTGVARYDAVHDWYAAQTLEAYAIIREAYPEGRVVTGGPAYGTGEFGFGPDSYESDSHRLIEQHNEDLHDDTNVLRASIHEIAACPLCNPETSGA